ncbi:3-hydroxyacyl-ACP dehydratase FabZ family protein [Taibaiella koreensis]|uniref:3-hydroxyacyl-ACP dehydratase FabZ family protein n=1 Tax=Taibaiella koreensis TaxID=1268548 RepID=UPI000E5995B9|nr:3-hydroxyacyl-ACP dehydratase FabZ family protein [Taibaiella koreensis]
MTTDSIIASLPYAPPFLFVDRIHSVNQEGIEGSFYLDPELDFFKGHFPHQAVTPGVILTEIMAQIGLVCLGIYLNGDDAAVAADFPFALTATEIAFYIPVYPGERVRVSSTKIYFRFGKLKCKVQLYNQNDVLACEGTLSGMCVNKPIWKEES